MQSEKEKAAAIWRVAANRLKEKSEPTYEMYFANVVPVGINPEGALILGVSDDFFLEWMSGYTDMLSNALRNIDGIDYAYTLESGHQPEIAAKIEERPVRTSASVESFPNAPEPIAPINGGHRHTFDNFVVGEENRYAFAACKKTATQPGVYNPLYIYGSTGTGKTHLLQAVATEYYRNNPHAIIRYQPCEEILNNFVASLAAGTAGQAEFRASLRNVDMLLVDDVHMLAGKGALQEMFFNVFNALYQKNSQIILTSDKQPCEIKGLEDRLVSRFEWGLTTEISSPGFEIRLAILKQLQEDQQIKLDDEVLQFIAQNISSSVRRLQGALTRLVGFSSAMHQKITIERAESMLHSLIEEENASRIISIEDIQRKVAEHFDIRMSDILSQKRPKNIAEPRMIAMYLCRRMTNYSFPEIGAAFGKNHATVINAMKKVPELCERDESIRRSVALLERQLKH